MIISTIKNFYQRQNQSSKVWLYGCPHLEADIAQGRNSISKSLSQIEAVFDYDLAICHGDYDAKQDPPTLSDTTEGEDIVSAYATSSKLREIHYTLAGNHDGGDDNMDWYLRYIDPLGDNTSYSNVDDSKRPFPIRLMESGSWHSYYIVTGKIMHIILSDRNELPYPNGRGGSVVSGGHPSGTISRKTWEWVRALVLNNKNKNIFIHTHQNPRDTTIGTPDNDGVNGGFHGSSGISAGSGSLYSIYNEGTSTPDDAVTEFLDFLNNYSDHTVVAWCAGHTHIELGENYNGKIYRHNQYGVEFINVGNLSLYHVSGKDTRSTLLTIEKDVCTFQTFLHEAVGANPVGIYSADDFTLNLKV